MTLAQLFAIAEFKARVRKMRRESDPTILIELNAEAEHWLANAGVSEAEAWQTATKHLEGAA